MKAARASLSLTCAVAGISLAAAADLGFTGQLTPGLFAAYTRLFGSEVRERLNSWVEFGRTQKAAPRVKRLLESESGEESPEESGAPNGNGAGNSNGKSNNGKND